jgi:putative ABC transport system ATP-binding protein
MHIAALVEDAVKIYGHRDTEVRALDEVTVSFAGGRFTAVMGPSGSGKSTLLHCLAGLDTLTSGRVQVGGVELSELGEQQRTALRRDRIGFVFQSFNLIPTLTAAENIALPLSLAGRTVDRGWFDEIVELVGLGDRLGHRPAELSGGQRQRVAVARALITRPGLVIADEPTGNLDSCSAAEILTFLRRLSDEYDQTVVMVTHDPLAASFASRVEFLVDGRHDRSLDEPTPDKVLAAIQHLGSP